MSIDKAEVDIATAWLSGLQVLPIYPATLVHETHSTFFLDFHFPLIWMLASLMNSWRALLGSILISGLGI